MSSTIVGMILGGILIMSLSAGSSLFVEKKNPSPKALARDFIVGSVLVALIMQLLPESSESVITSLFAVIPTSLALPSFPSMTSFSGGSGGDSETTARPTDDMEVQVGVPKF